MSQIDELRRIIAGDSSRQLKELRRRVEDVEARTADVAEVLAPAIQIGMEGDDSLISALKKPVSEGLKQAIRTEPDVYAEILYPAISPSIRKAISQAISSLMETINQAVASATTANGIKTRIESFRTGIPFAELVLRESLVYRVDHVYLIERDSGLKIEERHSEGAGLLDSDAVSAMFSAIASFVQDSFSASKGSHLTDFKVGSHTVWAAHGSKLMLVCVITGDPPQSLKDDLYDALDAIRIHYSNQIANFSGDSSQFIGVDSFLDPVMQVRLKDGKLKEGHRTEASELQQSSLGTMLIGVMLVVMLSYFTLQEINERTKLSTVKHYLSNVPGLVLIDVYWNDGEVVVEGLKDERAVLPNAILKAHGFDVDKLLHRTSPFISLDPRLE